ncbi:MAG: glutaredoxin 3 [Candidatus Omnitrophota bacterium]|jgi:glutaredoxin 3
MPKAVRIYTKQVCPYCRRAKELLKSKEVAFEEVDVSEDQAKRDELAAKTGMATVPLIFIGDQFVGGSDDLQELEDSGKLDGMLA